MELPLQFESKGAAETRVRTFNPFAFGTDPGQNMPPILPPFNIRLLFTIGDFVF
jgi:hypothetical protein